MMCDHTAAEQWAADSLGDQPVELMEGLLSKMPVSLIGAPRLLDCDADDSAFDVLCDPQRLDFDQIPVREAGSIIGVLLRGRGNRVEKVREVMEPLREGLVMAIDAPMLDFVENADTNRFALLLNNKQITSIVTLSDLQKVAVRPALFALLALVEMLLAEWIRLKSSGDEWLGLLCTKLQKRVQDRYKRLRGQNLMVDKISATVIEEKISAAVRLPSWPAEWTNAESELDEIASLRNSVFHHHDFGATQDDAIQICKRVRLARKYIRLLDKDMPPSNPK